MNLTTEQIQAILDDERAIGRTHMDNHGYFTDSNKSLNLSQLREILELRQEVERLKSAILQIGTAPTLGGAENALTYAESLCQQNQGR